MSRKKQEQADFEIRQFTQDEIDRGTAQLRERIEDVQRIDPSAAAAHSNNSAEVVESNVRNTILRVFGERSPEFHEHRYIRIWAGSLHMNMHPSELRQGIADGKTAVVAVLESLIKRLEQESKSSPDPSSRARKAFGELDLNPRIGEVATELYLDGHYSQAVFEASKALVNLVKERSGRHDLDGSGLMTTVFSPTRPILAFNNLAAQTDIDEQLGLMHLCAGAVLAIRNPGGHSFPDLTATQATQYIGFLSMLADRVRASKRVASSPQQQVT